MPKPQRIPRTTRQWYVVIPPTYYCRAIEANVRLEYCEYVCKSECPFGRKRNANVKDRLGRKTSNSIAV